MKTSFGFTGTQEGMTAKQKVMFRALLELLMFEEFHHGDCIGADEDAHNIIRKRSSDIFIYIHPPDNPSKQAFCEGDFVHKSKPYLVRNQDIVDGCEILIATPATFEEQRRSGTWSTVRRAREAGKMIMIIQPDGLLKVERGT